MLLTTEDKYLIKEWTVLFGKNDNRHDMRNNSPEASKYNNHQWITKPWIN